MAWQAIWATAEQVGQWATGVAPGIMWDPRAWQTGTWLVLALVVVALLVIALLARRGAPSSLPEMMVSHGQIVLGDAEQAQGGNVPYGLSAPAEAAHHLSLTLSNLNPWPVQLLELAVRTRGLRQPVVAVAGSVVPPNGAVDVAAELFDLPGDAGVIELYLYSNRGGKRTFKLSAPLEWEPWDQRYRVKALSSKVAPVTTLASQERRKREARSYRWAKRRQRQRELAEATWRRAEELGRQVKERRANAAEGRLAAQQPQAWPGGHPVGAPHVGSAAPHNGGEQERRAAENEPRQPVQPAQRAPMEFPDEF